MNTVIGDLLKVKRGIICHQVNCKYVMGAGLAAQIRKAYPEHYSDYMSRHAHLGGLCITQINSDLYVIGIYGQDSYGRNGLYTDYAALEKGLCSVSIFAKEKGLPIYLPFGIGCGLAGGDWQIVSNIIDRVASDAIVLKKSSKN